MNLIQKTVALTASLACLMPCAWAGTPFSTHSTLDDTHYRVPFSSSYLFVQHADQSTITPTHAKKQYRITLKPVSQSMIYFTDRPQTHAGETTLPKFMAAWKRNAHQKSSAPFFLNGVLEGLTFQENGQLKQHRWVFSLSQPQWNQDHQALHYNATLLHGKPLKKHFTLYHSNLFIDNLGSASNCGFMC